VRDALAPACKHRAQLLCGLFHIKIHQAVHIRRLAALLHELRDISSIARTCIAVCNAEGLKCRCTSSQHPSSLGSYAQQVERVKQCCRRFVCAQEPRKDGCRLLSHDSALSRASYLLRRLQSTREQCLRTCSRAKRYSYKATRNRYECLEEFLTRTAKLLSVREVYGHAYTKCYGPALWVPY
jgi:hypothetical protein